jgi:hypothetical protein
MSEFVCGCGFEAKNKAGLKSHQRACDYAGLPLRDQLYKSIENGVAALESEIAADAPQIVILAEQYQTYMMVYSAMRQEKGLVSSAGIEKHLRTVPGPYRDLYRERQALRKLLFDKAPDGRLHKPHPDHLLMKKEREMETELKRMLKAAVESVQGQWQSLIQERLPDKELRNLVLQNYELYEAQNQ